jgi:hypothetical protein
MVASDERLAQVGMSSSEKVDRRTIYETVWHDFADRLTRVPNPFAINHPDRPCQKDSLDNQKFTQCVAIAQGFLAPLAPPSPPVGLRKVAMHPPFDISLWPYSVQSFPW